MVKIIRMKNYTILLIVLILISCQCNKGKALPSDRYVDSIQHIEYKIQKNLLLSGKSFPHIKVKG